MEIYEPSTREIIVETPIPIYITAGNTLVLKAALYPHDFSRFGIVD
ncbi:MAG: hypothetical protein LBB98_02575 [Treponema sp.]|jgi:hypothetical protein|nr:hypothetical protein [Treponema sp.]